MLIQTQNKKQVIRGFTLVELMITVAILSVIMVIAIPAYNGYITEARIATARSNLDSLKLFLEDYRLDNDCYSPGCGGSTTITGVNNIMNVFGWNPRKESDHTYVLTVDNDTYTANVTYSGGWINCSETDNCTYYP